MKKFEKYFELISEILESGTNYRGSRNFHITDDFDMSEFIKNLDVKDDLFLGKKFEGKKIWSYKEGVLSKFLELRCDRFNGISPINIYLKEDKFFGGFFEGKMNVYLYFDGDDVDWSDRVYWQELYEKEVSAVLIRNEDGRWVLPDKGFEVSKGITDPEEKELNKDSHIFMRDLIEGKPIRLTCKERDGDIYNVRAYYRCKIVVRVEIGEDRYAKFSGEM